MTVGTVRDVGKFDHLRLILDPAYLRQCRRATARGNIGVTRLVVVHEPDDSCCNVEPWLTTRARLLQVVEP